VVRPVVQSPSLQQRGGESRVAKSSLSLQLSFALLSELLQKPLRLVHYPCPAINGVALPTLCLQHQLSLTSLPVSPSLCSVNAKNDGTPENPGPRYEDPHVSHTLQMAPLLPKGVHWLDERFYQSKGVQNGVFYPGELALAQHARVAGGFAHLRKQMGKMYVQERRNRLP
jgi:hypothetical protein